MILKNLNKNNKELCESLTVDGRVHMLANNKFIMILSILVFISYLSSNKRYDFEFFCNNNVFTQVQGCVMMRKKEVCLMAINLNVAMAPKDSTFQVRINSEIKKAVEEIYAKTGMTLTDAFNTFIQQSLNVEGLPFIVTKNSKEALKEQAIAMLLLDLKRAEKRAEIESWIDADDLEKELGVLD